MLIQMDLWVYIMSVYILTYTSLRRDRRELQKIFHFPYFIGCRSKQGTDVLWFFLHTTAQMWFSYGII